MNKNSNFQALMLFGSLISLISAGVYLVYQLNLVGVILAFLIAVLAFIYIKNRIGWKFNKIIWRPDWRWLVGYLIIWSTAITLLITARSDAPIISPWQVVSPWLFAVYGLATIYLIMASLRQAKGLTLLFSLHYLLSFSVALIVYKINYGYDPFIHQATLDYINKFGAVAPKQLYYAGYYGLIMTVHKLFFLPIYWLDRLFVPCLAAITLPLIIKKIADNWHAWQTPSNSPLVRGREDSPSPFQGEGRVRLNLLILANLILPFGFFILTTPQNLAYLFLIMIIALGLNAKAGFDWLTMASLSLATFFIQPIAGLPAIFLTLALYLQQREIKKSWLIIIASINALSLPILFYVLNPGKLIWPTWSINKLFSLPNQENFYLNFIYLLNNNYGWLIIILIIAGLIIWQKKHAPIPRLYLMFVVSLLISAGLSSCIDFSYLIDYERANFSDRILSVSILLALPFIWLALVTLMEKIIEQQKIIKYAWLAILTLALIASFYLAYPRKDNFFDAHGYATSAMDIQAVRWISNDSAKADYIVLANQQTSAASLNQFGFAKYYQNNIFYYPIPTGGPLYQYYLQMIKQPSRATMDSAMVLANVRRAYFVLNAYWYAAPKLIAEAKLASDSFQQIGDNYIFRVNR